MWEEGLEEFAAAGIPRIGSLGATAAAHSPELRGWYDAVYRAACEPAHISDLLFFLPDLERLDIEAGKPRMGPLNAQIAVNHGFLVMCDTVRFISSNDQGMSLDVTPFEQRVREIPES